MRLQFMRKGKEMRITETFKKKTKWEESVYPISGYLLSSYSNQECAVLVEI